MPCASPARSTCVAFRPARWCSPLGARYPHDVASLIVTASKCIRLTGDAAAERRNAPDPGERVRRREGRVHEGEVLQTVTELRRADLRPTFQRSRQDTGHVRL